MTRGDTVREPPVWVRSALVIVVVLPIIVAVTRALRHHWIPIGDSALLYIRARDVLTAHHPLLGSWTSASLSVGEDMNNPGPLYDDLLAPVARTLPFSSAAAVGVGLVNVATIIGISAASRRIAGWAMQRWMLLACAVVVWVMGSEVLIDIWQAHALLLPFVFFVVLAVGIGLGRGWCVPWAAAVASLLVQTHVSYVFVVVVITIAATAVFAITHRPLRWSGWRNALRSKVTAVTVVVVVVLWAQPIVEQLFGSGKGNLARLATNASGGDVRVGVDDGVRLTARILTQPPWRLRSGFSTLIPTIGVTETSGGSTFQFEGIPTIVPATVSLLVVVALLIVLGWGCSRRQRPAPAAACWIAAGGAIGAPLALAQVTVGEVGFAQHHVRWLWALGVFAAVVVVWSSFELIVARWPSPAVRSVVCVAPLALGVAAALAALPYLAQQQGPIADYEAMPALRRVFGQLESLEAVGPVIYDTANVRVYEPYSSAVMMRLQELGVGFRVRSEGMVRQLGERRRADGSERTTIFQLEGPAALHYEGAACTIALASAFSPEDEATLGVTSDAIAGALVRGELQVRPGVLDGVGAERFAAARRGDRAAAIGLVEDGTLRAFLDRGAITGRVPAVAGLESAVARIDDWVASTYRLLAVGPAVCP